MATSTESRDREIVFDVDGGTHKALVRAPARPDRRAALLITLCGTRQDSLNHADHRRVADIFTAAGHNVTSVDLPNHGDLVDAYGTDLPGMAAAMEDGHDVFAQAGRIGHALIDAALQEGMGANGVVVFGTSRGGLAALHIMGNDARVTACAVNAPLTYVPAPSELSHLADNPTVQGANALALVPRLRNRAIFMAIGMCDPRVGAEHCFEFHAALCAASASIEPVLFITPEASHDAWYPGDTACQAAAAFLLSRHTEHAKCLGGRTSQP